MLTLLFFFFTSLVWSQQNCPEAQNKPQTDLRKEFGPLRSQDTIGWCFSYATTDLLSHWIYKTHFPKSREKSYFDTRKRENMISAVWGTARYYENRREHINALRQYGGKETQLVSEYNKLMNERHKLFANAAKIARQSSNKDFTRLYPILFAARHRLDTAKGEEAKDLKTIYNETNAKILAVKKSDDKIEAAIDDLQTNIQAILDVKNKLGLIRDKGDLETGDPKIAFQMLADKNIGFCREAEVPSDDTQLPKYFKEFKNLEELMQEVYKYFTTESPSEEQLKCSMVAAHNLFPNLDLNKISWILRSYRDKADPIFVLARAACKNKLIIDDKTAVPDMVELANPANNNFAEVKQLLSLDTPVEIAYDANRVFSPSDLIDPNKKTLHASVIVGQQYNCSLHEMEYIIRDSVGGADSCNIRLKSFKDRNLKAPYSCDKGHYVLPQSLLSKHAVAGYAIMTKAKK